MELKPCPFCGSAGKMFKAEWLTPDMRYTTYQFGCENKDCPCSADRFSTACTEEVAIAAWNTRAERTGCIKEDETGFLVCSECGAIQPEEWTVYYCWSCGAKVVE